MVDPNREFTAEERAFLKGFAGNAVRGERLMVGAMKALALFGAAAAGAASLWHYGGDLAHRIFGAHP